MALLPRRRWRRIAGALLAVVALLTALGLWLRPRAEARLRTRLVAEAARRGWQATIEDVRLGLFPLLTVRGVRLSRPGVGPVQVEWLRVPLRPGLLLGRARVEAGAVDARLPGDLALAVQPTTWELPLRPSPAGGQARLLEGDAGLEAEWDRPEALAGSPEKRLRLRLVDLPATRLLALTRDRQPLLDAGLLSGELEARQNAAETSVKLVLTAVGLRAVQLSPRDSLALPEPLGPPRDMTVELEGAWRPEAGSLELKRWAARSDGLSLSGSLLLSELRTAPRLDLHLVVDQLDFARVLKSAGLDAPEAVAAAAGGPSAGRGDLGAASLELRVSGQLADPASFKVRQQIDFRAPTRRLPALERLRGDFVHEAVGRDGARTTILVTPGSPDFVPLADVPPLFVRTLLLGEDAGFWGHRGVDFSELPAALLTNLARGKAARGASTITQQLAKNLFLSRDKAMGRKLQELCLALLLEATLDKQRILEIYLNVIEWGPGFYGLRPAAQHYFGREPRELTPAQMALLVALIPGPVKYQSALAGGRPSSGFRPMMDTLLARLRSVDELDEEQYQAALAEDVVLLGAGALPPAETVAAE